MKKKCTLLFVIVMSITASNAAIVNGTCGDNLTWSLNTKDSTLIVEGSGDMDYWNQDSDVPWYIYRSYIKYVMFPEGLTSIGNYVFKYNNFLTQINIPIGVKNIGKEAFNSCQSLISATIPSSVLFIGEAAFQACPNISSINIPENVISIARYAFRYNQVSDISIPNSVTFIGQEAFSWSPNLESITIGNGLTNIGSSPFGSCPIKRLTMCSVTPPSGGADCGINASNCTLYVPEEAIETYSNTLWWEDFANIRPIGSSLMVKFVDWDGKVLSYSYVESGESAVAPSDPTRDGYTFVGWDKDFSNVTEDIIVTALYEKIVIPTYTISYNDKDNLMLGSEDVILHVPDAPEIEGFSFLKWQASGDLENGIILQAIYKTNVPTEMPEVYTNPANSAQKLIRNGNVYILKDDRTYTITGQEVR